MKSLHVLNAYFPDHISGAEIFVCVLAREKKIMHPSKSNYSSLYKK